MNWQQIGSLQDAVQHDPHYYTSGFVVFESVKSAAVASQVRRVVGEKNKIKNNTFHVAKPPFIYYLF